MLCVHDDERRFDSRVVTASPLTTCLSQHASYRVLLLETHLRGETVSPRSAHTSRTGP
jgi:hypothetical protein